MTAQVIDLRITVQPLDDFDEAPSPAAIDDMMKGVCEECYALLKKYNERGLVTVGFLFAEEYPLDEEKR